MIRTGIFGGSFNPIHNGHILLARQLKERARLDEVWLMVSPQNPLKKGDDLLDDDKRMKMARMAVADEKDIIGGDNWELFDKWYHADDIKANYEVVVYTRTPGDEGFIDISSTDIRQRVKAGRSIRSLVPKAVADFIKKNGYYA